jgi:hypothetical protein
VNEIQRWNTKGTVVTRKEGVTSNDFKRYKKARHVSPVKNFGRRSVRFCIGGGKIDASETLQGHAILLSGGGHARRMAYYALAVRGRWPLECCCVDSKEVRQRISESHVQFSICGECPRELASGPAETLAVAILQGPTSARSTSSCRKPDTPAFQ